MGHLKGQIPAPASGNVEEVPDGVSLDPEAFVTAGIHLAWA
jgi:hypothetical protein